MATSTIAPERIRSGHISVAMSWLKELVPVLRLAVKERYTFVRLFTDEAGTWVEVQSGIRTLRRRLPSASGQPVPHDEGVLISTASLLGRVAALTTAESAKTLSGEATWSWGAEETNGSHGWATLDFAGYETPLEVLDPTWRSPLAKSSSTLLGAIESEVALEGLLAAAACASSDTMVPVLGHVFIAAEPEGLAIWATDRRWLVHTTYPQAQDLAPVLDDDQDPTAPAVHVPARWLSAVAPLLSGRIQLWGGATHTLVGFSTEDLQMWTVREGTAPRLPADPLQEEPGVFAEADAAALSRLVRKASALSETPGVDLAIYEDEIGVSPVFSSAEDGAAPAKAPRVAAEVTTYAPSLDSGVGEGHSEGLVAVRMINSRYLEKTLSLFKGERVRVSFARHRWQWLRFTRAHAEGACAGPVSVVMTLRRR